MRRIVFFVVAFQFLCFFTASGQHDAYARYWQRVYKYEIKALPKSALGVVDSIYVRAKASHNIQEITKALLYQSKFSLILNENAELEVVRRWKKEISTARAPHRNILESMLACMYWDYFKENRYTYYQRSTLNGEPLSDDFRTWDAKAILTQIDTHLQNSLRNTNELQHVKLTELSGVLIEAEYSQLYRPYLYDLLVHNAIQFYSTDEAKYGSGSTRFPFNAKDYESFDALNIADSSNRIGKVISLYREALAFHKSRHDTAAIVNLEVNRIKWVDEVSSLRNKTIVSNNILDVLRQQYRQHPSSTLIDFEQALRLYTEGVSFESGKAKDPKNKPMKREAAVLCRQAIAAFPGSHGALQCKSLLDNILAQGIKLRTEAYLPVKTPARILVEYTNLDSVTFEVSRSSAELEDQFNKLDDSSKLVTLANLKAESVWTARLKNPGDYQLHTTEVVVPALESGNYIIVARVYNPSRSIFEQTFAFSFIQVTDLVLLNGVFDDTYRFQVVNRTTGEPVVGATVVFNKPVLKDSINRFTTNKNGFITIPSPIHESYSLEASVQFGTDQATFGNYYLSRSYRSDDPEEEDIEAKTFLFTDRSIYRPGQTVFFKGILIKTKNKKSSIVSGEFVEVFLEDVNNDEVGKLRLKTNSFGSFSGEFKLPATGLTGEYTLYADEDEEDPSGFYENVDFDYQRTEISVEEYKRPTFEVTFKPITKTFSIGDTIMLNGSASAFNGATLSNARIHYAITRSTRISDRRFWRYESSGDILVSADTTTGADGSFSIPLIALADEDVDKEHLPVFTYEVEVAVTDISGETHSAESSIHVGYHTLSVSLDVPKTIDRAIAQYKMNVSTKNLNGQPVPAKGTVRIYKLAVPLTPQRPRPWSAPDLPMLSQDEFSKVFPNDAYYDNKNGEDAVPEKLIFEIPFNTIQSSALTLVLNQKWSLGSYLVEVTAFDSAGYEIKSKYPLKVTDAGSKEVPDNQVLFFQTNKEHYQVGDLVRLTLGSASRDVTIMLDIECETGFVKSSVEHFSNSSRTITFPVTESMKNGFSIRASGVNYNHFFSSENRIPVVRTVNLLTLETLTFKDKLQPGTPYTWSFEVKGIPANKDAEVLASMYDASLDQFKPHNWYFDPHDDRDFRSNSRVSSNESFAIRTLTVRNRPEVPFIITRRYYDQFDWFGFGITRAKILQDSYLYRLYSTKSTPEKPSRISMSTNRAIKDGFVYGTVVDPHGNPLPGLSVTVAGTVRGTITDALGNYMLEVKKGEVLRFSFIGLNTIEAKVGRRNTINVFMEEDVTQLSEMVVMAAGLTVQRRELGNQATTVVVRSHDSPYAFEVYEPMAKLSGRVPGLLVSDIELNKDYRIVLRGQRSLTDTQQVLYVVDGVIVSGVKINTEDIANIETLSGAAATALYGSDAAHGVIIVTTKSGQRKLDEALAKVNVRKNFNETAFFFPHLITNEMGRVRFTFTTPESLTRWKMQLLAHTDNLFIGESTMQAVTQKELMISPNVPRFLREGDEITLSAKITNLSNQKKDGFAILQLTDAVTGKAVDKSLGNIMSSVRFKVSARQNTEVSWRLRVPADIEAVQYKIVAKAGSFGDGEQNIIPVLSNRMVVTETLPMSVRAGESKTFSLDKLMKSDGSFTLKHHALTLEITSNPAWYAIRSLPYLMEYPHECAEQLFSRYYANALASHIVNSNPKIKMVFDQWASSGALIGNLEKNPELKTILIQETPWLRDAQNETEQQKRIALLFDLHAMNAQLSAVVTRLSDLQYPDGSYPWFSGGRPNEYITRHIVASFGHLRKLGIKKDHAMLRLVEKSVTYLDNEFLRKYFRESEYKGNTFVTTNGLDNDIIHYLYMRSFFPEIEMTPNLKAAVEYYLKQGAGHWISLSLYTKGMMALIQFRNNNLTVANDILSSLRENSITSEELGMYWKENETGWHWYQSPVETQALLIEAFAEIQSADKTLTPQLKQSTIDELRLWLLKNKQTSQWKTTRATAEAIYALLLQGTDWLTIDQRIDVEIGNKKLVADTSKVETGTGYFKTTWNTETITASMGSVKINNTSNTIVWGGLYWQYAEQLDGMTSAETALKLSKKVFKVIQENTGESLTEVNETIQLQPGDLLRVRIELRTDRNMEFIHMKDMRAAGVEPVDVLSQYKWQEGLGYYQSTKDASTNFFFDRIPKGVYVFEYDLRVNSRGDFANGITTIQCMYAPEFSSHSEGIRISVK